MNNERGASFNEDGFVLRETRRTERLTQRAAIDDELAALARAFAGLPA